MKRVLTAGSLGRESLLLEVYEESLPYCWKSMKRVLSLAIALSGPLVFSPLSLGQNMNLWFVASITWFSNIQHLLKLPARGPHSNELLMVHRRCARQSILNFYSSRTSSKLVFTALPFHEIQHFIISRNFVMIFPSTEADFIFYFYTLSYEFFFFFLFGSFNIFI